jgi:hypothetical protein
MGHGGTPHHEHRNGEVTGQATASLPQFAPVHFKNATCSGPGGTVGNPANGGAALNITEFGIKLTHSTTPGNNSVIITYIGPPGL